jgi:putative NIF3 family GTP cyclohydrolase 1 type 2
MLLNHIVRMIDEYLQYLEYPDFIVDILQQVDTSAPTKFQQAYLQKQTGLMIDNGKIIHSLYCASFPSEDLLIQLNKYDISNALLVVKHPMDWQEMGQGFKPISVNLLSQMHERSISLYCAHAAHDNNLDCSPSRLMAEALGLKLDRIIKDEFGRVFGYVITTEVNMTFLEFRSLIANTFDLKMMQQRYLHDRICRIAVISGGGDNVNWLKIAEELDCDTYLTGILYFRGSDYAKLHNPVFIDELKKSSLNAFGISHYISEKGGSLALAKTLATKLKIPTAFLPEVNKEQEIQEYWSQFI